MGLKVGTVELYPYDENWIIEFEQEKVNLENIFKDLAIAIEHIGSTSIPGLSAKPIIDIAVGLERLEEFEKVRSIFERINDYRIKENPTPGEMLVVKGMEDITTHLIHVMEYTSSRYTDSILFRDYLINHPDVVKEYENLKVELAEKYADNRKMYTASKNDFIQTILTKTKE
jgi:GrpB-like predicted nucleotidyltransferase (UPF0157 family)